MIRVRRIIRSGSGLPSAGVGGQAVRRSDGQTVGAGGQGRRSGVRWPGSGRRPSGVRVCPAAVPGRAAVPAPGPGGTGGIPRRAAASSSGPAAADDPDVPGTEGRGNPPAPAPTFSSRRNLSATPAFPAFDVGVAVEESILVDLGLRTGLVPGPVAGWAGHEAQDELLVGRPEVPAGSLALSCHEIEGARHTEFRPGHSASGKRRGQRPSRPSREVAHHTVSAF